MPYRDQFAARKLANDAVAIGKKYSRTAYPNPSRTGCPGHETLKAMAKRDRRIVLQEMPISHIVTCSPCFNEYARYRRRTVALRGLQWAAAVVLITAATLAGSRLLRFKSPGQRPVTTAEKTGSAPAKAPSAPPTTPPESLSRVEVNLALFSATRGEDSGKMRQQIHLPAKGIHVLFLLPTGLEPGEYAVRLLDAAGTAKVQRQIKVALKDGVASFALDLQLRPSDSGRGWRLMIRPPGLSWRTYPIAID
ncbi:MAG TPA: hypothetical protein VJ731_13995 [Terriglobales bacterium]|nr:hypothetical protein [Terriglobales bacterium]